ncbi:MAG: bifunctional methylenetetrahydrofolate dehydrogenase/methenyltetrahydrofolate cyclohydrolase FolD [Candidatus Tectomicrobia bacterium]|uniref:Bifunctional protein FolD n=1 Tax=Tectimicrobiota bacterium TaxID=2528274 RepID=A0A932CQL6_UNCTE|nr:bifunctional methylenetetrahydrofolate dehydrogenase/methenyltetrahydrofolate cyclohydrolase FolD [Candidatus Tectomicrobia bacterium]
MKILYGKGIAQEVQQEIRGEIELLRGPVGQPPGLAVLLVGEDPASRAYVRNKQRACEEVGIRSFCDFLPQDISEELLLRQISSLNEDPGIHGILVQLPLPEHIRESKVIETISPEKDVDGFHPYNVARLFSSNPTLIPCTPRGILELLDRNQIELSGQRVVIIGSSYIVGKPLALLLLNRGAFVTLCHKYTRDLAGVAREGDILVTAVGLRGLVTAEMVKEGAVVIDVGISFVEGRTVGDVDFEGVARVAAAVTPVPGGVGPLTVTMLLKNTLLAYKLQHGIGDSVSCLPGTSSPACESREAR